MENLVIVESPAKAKTIERFLGKDFTVRSSFGHIRDLVKKDLGIDIEHNFTPKYEVDPAKKKLVSELASLAAEAKTVWLASDEDREGEAIAWHLAQVLKLKPEKTKRIVFHEITKSAILDAIEKPRSIDINLVDAQQARRILDRLVGFELSPVLWKKVRPSLSAGRVQSVAVRLIVEREREIIAFNATASYRVVAQFIGEDGKTLFKAELNNRFDSADAATEFLTSCVAASFVVDSVECKPATKSPAPPFTTSTLQQEAGRKLGMSVSQIMSTAQRLYESGLITYMRTDSVNLSGQAIGAIKNEIIAAFGEQYSTVRNYKTKTKGAQEAHEAIRPSYFDRHTVEGTPAEKRLYELIWKRTVASQMSVANIERTTVTIDISDRKEKFTAVGEVILFDGFLKLYIESSDDDNEQDGEGKLPQLKKGEKLSYDNIMAIESFTQSPPRYSEASLVKRLEELGIGRPSTYAPTITTIINRGYVVKQNRDGVKREFNQIKLSSTGAIASKVSSQIVGKEKNKLSPTDIGMVVNDYLETQFKAIIDYNFTADVEKEFDRVADGDVPWVKMIDSFYRSFHPTIEQALEREAGRSNSQREIGVDPKSGQTVIARIGRYGPMVQIGATDEAGKGRFASLRPGQLIASITLEEALELFTLPRTLGTSKDGGDVVVNIGRFGPYILHEKKFTSLPKTEDPYTVTLERAIEIIDAHAEQQKKAKEPIKVFPEEPKMQVLNGRYGPYIAFDSKNYRIPKGSVPEELTLEQCREIVAKSKK